MDCMFTCENEAGHAMQNSGHVGGQTSGFIMSAIEGAVLYSHAVYAVPSCRSNLDFPRMQEWCFRPTLQRLLVR